jgi:hypothetical protein
MEECGCRGIGGAYCWDTGWDRMALMNFVFFLSLICIADNLGGQEGCCDDI